MPVHLGEGCFIGPNSPARVGHKHTEMVESPCPNHEYRSRAKRMGQTAELCRLCLNQQEMAERWKNIRKAFMTIRSSSRRGSALLKRPIISAARNQWKVSIFGSLCPDAQTEGMRVVIAVDCGSGVSAEPCMVNEH